MTKVRELVPKEQELLSRLSAFSKTNKWLADNLHHENDLRPAIRALRWSTTHRTCKIGPRT